MKPLYPRGGFTPSQRFFVNNSSSMFLRVDERDFPIKSSLLTNLGVARLFCLMTLAASVLSPGNEKSLISGPPTHRPHNG